MIENCLAFSTPVLQYSSSPFASFPRRRESIFVFLFRTFSINTFCREEIPAFAGMTRRLVRRLVRKIVEKHDDIFAKRCTFTEYNFQKLNYYILFISHA
jgi:hypothetical protein